jgi:hypothetical protein
MKNIVALAALVAIAGSASARPLVDNLTDSTPGNTIGTYNYAGAGSGFGGTLGAGGISLDSDASNLYLRFTAGGSLNDLVAIFIDSRVGGFTDADMNDQADGGRRALSQLANATDDAFDADFRPDFGVIIGNFGTVFFELTAGNSDGHLNFLAFDAGTALPRDFSVSLSTLGLGAGSTMKFAAAYVSDSGYLSNESIPAYSALQSNGNPGFGDGQFGGTVGSPGLGNYNQFTVVPTPGVITLAGLAGLAGLRRRRA